MSLLNKRGSDASAPGTGGAAVLIAIIAAVLIFFVIVLPPDERADLLGDANRTSSARIDNKIVEKNLLLANPGRVDFLIEAQVEHPIPTVNIFTKKESIMIAEKNIASAKRSFLSEEVSEFSFTVEDLTHTENILLGFSVKSAQGKIIVRLNDEEIYNNEERVGAAPPIILPKNLIREENIITFAASSPGLAFFRTNGYTIEKIKVVGDIERTDAQTSKTTFLVSATEKKNLEKVVLRFQPDCKIGQVGRLHIEINGNEIYSGFPDCDVSFVPLEFSQETLRDGENELSFSTEDGTYVLSHITIQSKLKEVDFPTYYFDLSLEQYEQVKDDERSVLLRLDFVDNVPQKRGEIVINGHVKSFETKDVNTSMDLSDDIVRGSNSVKIRPKRTLEIRELRVDLTR